MFQSDKGPSIVILSCASKRRRTLFCPILKSEEGPYFVLCIKSKKAFILSFTSKRRMTLFCPRLQKRRRHSFCPMYQNDEGPYLLTPLNPHPPPPNPHIDFTILRNCHKLIKKALPRSPIRPPPPTPRPSPVQ